MLHGPSVETASTVCRWLGGKAVGAVRCATAPRWVGCWVWAQTSCTQGSEHVPYRTLLDRCSAGSWWLSRVDAANGLTPCPASSTPFIAVKEVYTIMYGNQGRGLPRPCGSCWLQYAAVAPPEQTGLLRAWFWRRRQRLLLYRPAACWGGYANQCA